MGNISVSLPSDGTTADVSDYNNPINAIVNEFNGNIDNTNIKAGAAIDGTKIASNSIPNSALAGSITGDKLTGGSYSTSEVNTGAKWVDGKDIYKKTLNTGVLPNNSVKDTAHNITGLSNFIELSGIAWTVAGTYRPLPYAASGTNFIGVFADSTNVRISTASDMTVYTSSYVTMYYTKT